MRTPSKYPELKELKEKMRKERKTNKRIAARLGINAKTCGAKLNGQYECTVSEAFKIADILGIHDNDIRFYFKIPKTTEEEA